MWINAARSKLLFGFMESVACSRDLNFLHVGGYHRLFFVVEHQSWVVKQQTSVVERMEERRVGEQTGKNSKKNAQMEVNSDTSLGSIQALSHR